MLVLSNHRLGSAAELMVSRAIGSALLIGVANAARPRASTHWEHELVRWLEGQVTRISSTTAYEIVLDVSEIAFTPRYFERQRRFLLDAISEARLTSEHSRTLARWAHLIEAHPRDSVQFGRRWVWHTSV